MPRSSNRYVRNFMVVVAVCMGYCVRESQAEVDYLKDVKPILKSRCYACHGALMQKAGLRLDTVGLMRRGGDNGDILKRGDSLLIEKMTAAEPSEKMPPEGEGAALAAADIEKVKSWVAAGAKGPDQAETPEPSPRDHWAFQPVVRPKVPVVANQSWVKNPIDSFIAHDLEKHGLKPAPRATDQELLRRLYFDLVGLPPDWNAVNAVSGQASGAWYETKVDALLKDPRHGQRWARHWMDIWRYSDWWGLGAELRNSQKHIWQWRDWLVQSINADKPYHEMVRLMLAGDEMQPNDLDALRATGFLARNYFLFNRNQWLDETVEHVSKAFMGITMNCAKCHDHKYDPIRQTDYYGMRAIFEPYMVRNEILPGEVGIEKSAIPRAYDARPDEPTYRFIRGQEGQPDKSRAIAPGVPGFLGAAGFQVSPVKLPVSAVHPELRPFILESQRKAITGRLESARSRLAESEKNWQMAHAAVLKLKLENGQEKSGQELKYKQASAALEAEMAKNQAERQWQAARAELAALEARAVADQAVAGGANANEVVLKAVSAEREAALWNSEAALAGAELAAARAEAKQQPEMIKKLEAARGEVEKARKALLNTAGKHTPLQGAVHAPTKFLSSTAFDPEKPFPEISSGRRLGLARWLTDPKHPLTARVAVNHMWARHMGQPLVGTLFDFGRKGQPPVNQDLLDWLAAELVSSGWSMKHVHRLILNSATYQMTSSVAGLENNLKNDPDNRHFWHRPPVRIESQVLRDMLLAQAGELDSTMGGPPVEAAAQADSKRRSLYFFHSNNDRNAFLTTFDEALVKECYQREQSIVPQQALALANAKIVLDAAPKIAARLEAEMQSQKTDIKNDAAFVKLAFSYLLGFQPGGVELAASAAALESFKNQADGPQAMAPRARLVWALLNHNDFVTLR